MKSPLPLIALALAAFAIGAALRAFAALDITLLSFLPQRRLNPAT